MIPFEKLNDVFSLLPEEYVPAADEEKEYVRKVAAVNTMRLWFIGN